MRAPTKMPAGMDSYSLTRPATGTGAGQSPTRAAKSSIGSAEPEAEGGTALFKKMQQKADGHEVFEVCLRRILSALESAPILWPPNEHNMRCVTGNRC